MSGGTLKVDWDALLDLARVLGSLRDEFEGMEDNMDSYSGAAGHDGVADAMNSFASNWSDDRSEIVENMEGVISYAEGAAEAYRETDDEVGNEFCQA